MVMGQMLARQARRMELISLLGLRTRSKIKPEFRQVLDDEKIACLWDLFVENARPRSVIYWRDWMVGRMAQW